MTVVTCGEQSCWPPCCRVYKTVCFYHHRHCHWQGFAFFDRHLFFLGRHDVLLLHLTNNVNDASEKGAQHRSSFLLSSISQLQQQKRRGHAPEEETDAAIIKVLLLTTITPIGGGKSEQRWWWDEYERRHDSGEGGRTHLPNVQTYALLFREDHQV